MKRKNHNKPPKRLKMFATRHLCRSCCTCWCDCSKGCNILSKSSRSFVLLKRQTYPSKWLNKTIRMSFTILKQQTQQRNSSIQTSHDVRHSTLCLSRWLIGRCQLCLQTPAKDESRLYVTATSFLTKTISRILYYLQSLLKRATNTTNRCIDFMTYPF